MANLNRHGKRSAPSAVFPVAQSKKTHLVTPIFIPNAARNLVDSLTEEHDLAAALALLAGLITPESAPDSALVRQLFALALDPLSLPLTDSIPTQDSRHKHDRARDPTAASIAKHRLIALALLRDIIATNGSPLLDKALPGYASSPAFDSLPLPTPVSSSAPKSSLRERKTPLIAPPNPALEFTIESDDSPLTQAGKRLGKSLDIWTALGGSRRKDGRVWSAERPVVQGGWEVLDVLVGLWEIEAQDRAAAGESPVSPSLLRQFATTPSGPRVISNQVLSIIFWPFSQDTSSATSSPVPVNGEDAMFEKAMGADLTRGEKCGIAARLMGLLGNLAAYSHFVGSQAIQDVTTWMKDLDVQGISEFLDRTTLTCPLFINRLLVHYLETFSHLPPTSSTPSQSINISPSRAGRQLGATASTASLLSTGDSSSQQSQPTTQSHSAPTSYFTPSLRPATLTALLSKIPRQIPLDEKTGELSTKKSDFKGRRATIAEVSAVDEIIKEALCACALVLEAEGVGRERGGEGVVGEGVLGILQRDGSRRTVGILLAEALERAT